MHEKVLTKIEVKRCVSVCMWGRGERKHACVSTWCSTGRQLCHCQELQHRRGSNMHQQTDSLKHITDLTHCWKQKHRKEHTHTHTHPLYTVFIRYCYIHCTNYRASNVSLFFYQIIIISKLWGLLWAALSKWPVWISDVSHIPHSPFVRAFPSLFAVRPAHSFTAFQNHPHKRAAEPTWTCHLFLFSQTGSCAEQLWPSWREVSGAVILFKAKHNS